MQQVVSLSSGERAASRTGAASGEATSGAGTSTHVVFLCLQENEQRRVQEQRAVKRRQEQERQLKKKQEAAGSRTFYVAQARLMYI